VLTGYLVRTRNVAKISPLWTGMPFPESIPSMATWRQTMGREHLSLRSPEPEPLISRGQSELISTSSAGHSHSRNHYGIRDVVIHVDHRCPNAPDSSLAALTGVKHVCYAAN